LIQVKKPMMKNSTPTMAIETTGFAGLVVVMDRLAL
jgi:hypothetical protein